MTRFRLSRSDRYIVLLLIGLVLIGLTIGRILPSRSTLDRPGVAPPTPTLKRIPVETVEVRTLSPRRERIDINTASAEELQQLPGIGPVYAARIIAYRTDHGGFGSIEELIQVPGIGPKTLERLRDRISVSGE
ncbi:MAG: ComEA family DNA-binding protein [Candidatus Bipolaricaulia bacterium]